VSPDAREVAASPSRDGSRPYGPATRAPARPERDFLVLEDGCIFAGCSVAARGVTFGEAVFTTGMSGYQEIVTDPSYAEQLVCFTAPMIGNYGVLPERDESGSVVARGVLMRRAGGEDWCRWLAEREIPAPEGIDTRSLVLRLRRVGALRAALVAGEGDPEEILAAVRAQPGMAGRALVAGVSTPEPYMVGAGEVHVALVDYGTKRSILRRLARAGARITVFPHDVPADEVLAVAPDGILLSNGPGDPAALPSEIAVVAELFGRAPMLGICLGHQLLGLAAGFSTVKLPFGHRGANHPVVERASGRVLVTSQNHGFAIEGGGPEISHVSLYDGTVEGLELPAERARSVQFHPEAGPGPHDAWPLLEGWVRALREEVVRARAA
jgi:carbamoyl-phosphate synthase small subunit